MRVLSPTGIDNLTDSVCRGCHLLEGDGKDTKEENLNRSTGGIPESKKKRLASSRSIRIIQNFKDSVDFEEFPGELISLIIQL